MRLSKPFDAETLREARELAARYRLIIEHDPDDGYHGCSVEMPLVMAHGDDAQACYLNTLEATAISIATMLEDGQRPPAPAESGKREEQLNVRLTSDERLRIEEAARRAGFRSISDFVRTAALQRAS